MTLSIFRLVLKWVWHDIWDSRSGGHCLLTVRSQLCRVKIGAKCVKYIWLSCPAWSSCWVLWMNMQWLTDFRELAACQITGFDCTYLLGHEGQLRCISHIWLWFWLHAISLWLSINNVPYIMLHSLQHQPKTESGTMHSQFLGTNTVYESIRSSHINPILNFYYVGNVEIRIIWNVTHKFVTEKLMQLWRNLAVHARSHPS